MGTMSMKDCCSSSSSPRTKKTMTTSRGAGYCFPDDDGQEDCDGRQEKNQQQRQPLYDDHLWTMVWYLIFGAIHELTHLMVAGIVIAVSSSWDDDDPEKEECGGLSMALSFPSISSIDTWLGVLLGRQTQLLMTTATATAVDANSRSGTDPHDAGCDDNGRIATIRHAGWIISVVIALLCCCVGNRRKRQISGSSNKKEEWWSSSTTTPMILAAVVTALEALWTDLLGWPVLSALSWMPGGAATAVVVLHCGNFGIILLHDAWFRQRNRHVALDVLERMIQITMMRGAQSGGVVVFGQQRRYGKQKSDWVGIRSRVVNKKRTDLSQLLRRQVAWDRFWHPTPTSTRLYCGHTRFATSSKASLDGTHPHQWTPATTWRFYYHQDGACFRPVRVENYITHNGDFDFYKVRGKTYDLELVQIWLTAVTYSRTIPAMVDSCAVAGVLDVLRTAGSFGLSVRYALCLALDNSVIRALDDFPTKAVLEQVGAVFEEELLATLKESSSSTTTITTLEEDRASRVALAMRACAKLTKDKRDLLAKLRPFLSSSSSSNSNGRKQQQNEEDDDAETASSPRLAAFGLATVHAFFDNDLFWSINTFLAQAKGSFGLCFASSLDAERQVCLAARGQTMSVAFYPNKGLVCYGSEQAAVKAGMTVEIFDIDPLQFSNADVDHDVLRLDLDDLGGETLCLDWSTGAHPVSVPHRHLTVHGLMHGKMRGILHSCSSKASAVAAASAEVAEKELYHRLTRLTRNRFIKTLQPPARDPVLRDLHDIPKALKAIQDDWDSKKAATSMNRLAAHTLSLCLRKRLEAHLSGQGNNSIDILLTGCEVSLWLAEQFATDLKKSFPLLRVEAASSNKLLGLYGQDLAIPSIGFPYSPQTHDLRDTIVIIVSHSGGTFSPLSCSNLLQSTTKNIFVVTSEWDTQIGKQLRAMDQAAPGGIDQLFKCRTFTTEVGLRAAEPCSISVAATHQLLTNLYQYICVTILNDPRYRQVSGSVMSEQDLQILEKCNIENIDALSEIVGRDAYGYATMDNDHKQQRRRVEQELRQLGNLWSEHVLENARAYIMCFLYIFGTVTSGYPLAWGIAIASGGVPDEWKYLVHLLDAAIYFWLPQISIIILRLLQGRNLRHRMVGRTVVIADIPWVAQSAEAFLSKMFACSYSIAGLNVHSGNPVDHLVHRHTHRVVRGTLLVAGRPDGRLSALSTAESATCLSVNQASSIQSMGGTCESVTIGHNPFQLPLTLCGIFLKRKRPMFLCERLLIEKDARADAAMAEPAVGGPPHGSNVLSQFCALFRPRPRRDEFDLSISRRFDSSIQPRVRVRRSSAALLGAFMNFSTHNPQKAVEQKKAGNDQDDKGSDDNDDGGGDDDDDISVSDIVESAIRERKWSDNARKMYQLFDTDNDGLITEDDFVRGVSQFKDSNITVEAARELFRSHAAGDEPTPTQNTPPPPTTKISYIDYDEFVALLDQSGLGQSRVRMPPSHRDEHGQIQIMPSVEKYFGETLRKYNAGKRGNDMDFMVARSQEFAMQLYESRIASLQRFVAMTILFHQMGTRVERFFEYISFGLWGYHTDRTHSIMRIATTASPVGGADVKQQMRRLLLHSRVKQAVHTISIAYAKYKARVVVVSQQQPGNSSNNNNNNDGSSMTQQRPQQLSPAERQMLAMMDRPPKGSHHRGPLVIGTEEPESTATATMNNNNMSLEEEETMMMPSQQPQQPQQENLPSP